MSFNVRITCPHCQRSFNRSLTELPAQQAQCRLDQLFCLSNVPGRGSILIRPTDAHPACPHCNQWINLDNQNTKVA